EEDSGDLTFGQPTSRELSVSGGVAPYSWSVSGLPRGLRLRRDGKANAQSTLPFSAEIWGTPLELGTFPVTVRLEDSSSPAVRVSQTFALRVVELDDDLPASGARNAPFYFKLRTIGGAPPYTWNILPTLG